MNIDDEIDSALNNGEDLPLERVIENMRNAWKNLVDQGITPEAIGIVANPNTLNDIEVRTSFMKPERAYWLCSSVAHDFLTMDFNNDD